MLLPVSLAEKVFDNETGQHSLLWVGVRLVLGHGSACRLGMCVIDEHQAAEYTLN